jgi:hypothetical protein
VNIGFFLFCVFNFDAPSNLSYAKVIGFNTSTALTAAGCVSLSFYPALDNISRSPHPGMDFNGIGGTIVDAGPAFHAGIRVVQQGLAVFQHKYLMRANLGTQPASDTKIFIKFECRNFF